MGAAPCGVALSYCRFIRAFIPVDSGDRAGGWSFRSTARSRCYRVRHPHQSTGLQPIRHRAKRYASQRAISALFRTLPASRRQPSDWVYVNNFIDPHKPIAIELPPGRAGEFRDGVHALIDGLKTALPAVFESEDYQTRRGAVDQAFQSKQAEAFSALHERAAAQDIAILDPNGFRSPGARWQANSSGRIQNVTRQKRALLILQQSWTIWKQFVPTSSKTSPCSWSKARVTKVLSCRTSSKRRQCPRWPSRARNPSSQSSKNCIPLATVAAFSHPAAAFPSSANPPPSPGPAEA